MRLIVITHPQYFKGEDRLLDTLFEQGLEYLHLRKPGSSRHEIVGLLQRIPEIYHKRIILHDNYKLVHEFGLGGIHVTGKSVGEELETIPLHLHYSRSCHSFDEVLQCGSDYSYVFLSPIYDSISKKGYSSSFDKNELQQFFTINSQITNCVALGGVTKDNIKELKLLGFNGAALLGSIWHGNDLTTEIVSARFKEIAVNINHNCEDGV